MSETNAVILDSRNPQIARQEPTVLEVIRELAVDERVSDREARWPDAVAGAR